MVQVEANGNKIIKQNKRKYIYKTFIILLFSDRSGVKTKVKINKINKRKKEKKNKIMVQHQILMQVPLREIMGLPYISSPKKVTAISTQQSEKYYVKSIGNTK